jgi:hypothetical protein
MCRVEVLGSRAKRLSRNRDGGDQRSLPGQQIERANRAGQKLPVGGVECTKSTGLRLGHSLSQIARGAIRLRDLSAGVLRGRLRDCDHPLNIIARIQPIR